MADMEEFAGNWNRLATDDSFYGGVIKDTAEGLVKVNQENLKDGMGSDGAPLNQLDRKFRRAGMPGSYRTFKMSLNPRAQGRYDMNLTGRSFDTMRLEVESGRYSIVGAGWANKYNNGEIPWATNLAGRIWGIYQSDHMVYYKTTYLYPLLQTRMRQYLAL